MKDVELTDPNIIRVNKKSNGKYEVKISELVNATKAHFKQHFYW